jgi:hypothetical protein
MRFTCLKNFRIYFDIHISHNPASFSIKDLQLKYTIF